MSVAFNKPNYDERELEHISDALLRDTDFRGMALQRLKSIYQREQILITSSGSMSLDLFFLSMKFPEGSEVIMPSYNYPSAANSVLRAGLKPVFAEIDRGTLVLDMKDVEQKITERTCCIITVHYGGASVDIDTLMNMARIHNITVVEDAALSIGAKYNGHPLGTIGHAGIVSFHPTKNVSGEGGGALFINSDRISYDAVTQIYDNGTDKRAYMSGSVPYYSWQQTGLNGEMSNINAAILYSQLEKFDEMAKQRQVIYAFYEESLKTIASSYRIWLPTIPEYNTSNHHVFYIRFASHAIREKVRLYLNKKGVHAYFHYMPLHASRMGHELGWQDEDLPISNEVAQQILRLPLYNSMTLADAKEVIDTLKEALCQE